MAISGGFEWWRYREGVSGGQSQDDVSGGDIGRVRVVTISGGCEWWRYREGASGGDIGRA